MTTTTTLHCNQLTYHGHLCDEDKGHDGACGSFRDGVPPSSLLADSHQHIGVPTMITHHIADAVVAAKAEAGRTSTYLPLEDILDYIDAEDGTEPDEEWCLPCGTRILEYGEQIVAVWDHEGECAVILDFDEETT